MRYLSLFSGVEAASVAWHDLGWTPVAFAEFEAFPSAVLAHRWPHVKNHGDVTKVDWKQYKGKVDIIVGGSPCQAFSVAGLRKSLDDSRGNLTLEYMRTIHAIRPKYFIWENVPGVLNTKDNALGCFFAGLAGADAPLTVPEGKWGSAGIIVGKEYSMAWRVLDAQHFGIPQRRRRIFVVGHLGDWRVAAKILFELQGLPRDPAAGGEAGQGAAPGPGQGAEGGGRKTRGGKSHWDGRPTHPSLGQCAKGSGGIGASNQEVFAQGGGGLVPHPASFTPAAHGVYKEGVGPVRASGGDCGPGSENIIAFSGIDSGNDHGADCAPTLRVGGTGGQGQALAVAYAKPVTYSTPAIGVIKEDRVSSTVTKNTGAGGETQNPAYVLQPAKSVQSFYPTDGRMDNFPPAGVSLPIKVGSGGTSGNPPGVCISDGAEAADIL